MIATVDVGGLPLAVAITPDGTRAYVAKSVPSFSVGTSGVSAIDTSSNTVVATESVAGIGDSPFSVAITADGTLAYVTIATNVTGIGNGAVAVIDTSSNTVVATAIRASKHYSGGVRASAAAGKRGSALAVSESYSVPACFSPCRFSHPGTYGREPSTIDFDRNRALQQSHGDDDVFLVADAQ